MRIRTPADLGALIRDRRIALGLDQKTLAEKVGASRQWVVDAEKGKPRSEIGLLLRTIGALGIVLNADKEGASKLKDTAPLPGGRSLIFYNRLISIDNRLTLSYSCCRKSQGGHSV